ncbi:MAG: sensor domain-containing diguanylate cyclase [Actinomycetes bacterium]
MRLLSGPGPGVVRRSPRTGGVFTDLGVAMAGFGILVGVVFPPVVVGLGVSRAQAFRPSFWAASLLAGLVVGATGWGLCRRIVGRPVGLLAGRTHQVAEALSEAAVSGDWTACDPQGCRIQLDSHDELGQAADAFNQLVDQLARMHQIQERHQGLTAGLLEHPGLTEVATWALGQVSRAAGSPAGAILLLDAGQLQVLASQGLLHPDRLGDSILVEQAITRASTATVALPEDVVLDAVIAGVRPRQVLVCPLQLHSAPIGALLLTFDHPVTSTEQRLIEIDARSLSLALHNAASRSALQALAAQDPLTGLLNRRYGEIRLAEEMARSLRTSTPIAVVMLDIDHFKAVNDAYGHLSGDRVLKAVATIAASALRQGDALVRFGGEEFLGLLPGADVADALEIAERIRAAITARPVRIGGLSVAVTVSAGVSSWPEAQTTTPTELIRLADTGLYRAKQAGRNRVEVATASQAGTPAHSTT